MVMVPHIRLSNMPLRLQSALGPAAVLLLFILSAIFFVFQLGSIATKVDLLNQADRLAELLYAAQSYQDSYLLDDDDALALKFEKSIDQATSLAANLVDEVGESVLQNGLARLQDVIGQYGSAFNKVVENTAQINAVNGTTTKAYQNITTLLVEKIKSPLEDKKNNALVMGEELSPYDAELLSLTERLFTQLMECRLAENNYFTLHSENDAKTFTAGMNVAMQVFDEWKFVIDTFDNPALKQYPKSIEEGFADYNSNTFSKRVALDKDQGEIIVQMLKLKEQGLDLIRSFKQETVVLVEETKKQGYQNLIIFLCLGIVFGLGISLYSGQRISRPVRNIVAMLKDIAEGEGDLTKRLTVKRTDELGEQAKWFNLFIAKIADMVKELMHISGQLSTSSDHLSTLAGRMTDNSGKMKQKSNMVAVAAEEMSGTIRNVACTMDQASNNMGTIVHSAEEMNDTIQGIAKNTEKAQHFTTETVALARKTSQHVDGLGDAALQIGKVTDAITDISDQTNLLALNATIEAARAGEAGRGFAVVANEIKELAKQTANATSEITLRVQNIQGAVQGAVDGIVEIDNAIHNVNEYILSISTAINEQSTVTRNIATHVAEASDGMVNINTHTTSGAAKAESISGDISSVDQIAGDISANGTEVDDNARGLSQLAGQLQTLVSKFIVD